MEQFRHNQLESESPRATVADLGFDMLRAVIAARQSASATARALAATPVSSPPPNGVGERSEQFIAMINRKSAIYPSGTFVSGETVATQDERHA